MPKPEPSISTLSDLIERSRLLKRQAERLKARSDELAARILEIERAARRKHGKKK